MDGEKVVVILLELLSGEVLGEKQLGKVFKIVDRALQKRVKPI